MSGMFATEEFIRTGSAAYWVNEFLQTHPEMKVLLMGVGGQQYNERETSVFLDFIKQKTNLAGFISRDNETYKSYKDLLSNCHPGIDCAFFVSDVYNPVGFASKDYVISTFNNMPEPALVKSLNCDVIRPEHMFYGAKYDDSIENIFISDAPYDYLSLYANAKEVHTDLVHATIVSLAYGTKVKYYHDSKRSFAFEAVGAIKDDQGYLYVPRETLQARKQAFIESVRKSLLS
ncbi:MAG: polysaccharide pyruvyl transferase family protein [Armatimonadetes bacterium]|nr:polysaccharide pyruvyl transferase family protein [Armatimonadota bacterium]